MTAYARQAPYGAGSARAPRSARGAHPRMVERRARVARARRRRNRPLVALIVLTVAAIAAVGVAASPVLDVDRIVVSGANRTGVDVARAASGIRGGDALVAVDAADAERRLEALPWVAGATVERRGPGTVEITLIERAPVATVGFGRDRLLVDREGRILGAAADRAGLPSLGARRLQDVPGAHVRDRQRELAEVVAVIPADSIGTVASVTEVDHDLRVLRSDGITVVLGDRTRIRAKFDGVRRTLAELTVRPQAGLGVAEIAELDARDPSAIQITSTIPPGP